MSIEFFFSSSLFSPVYCNNWSLFLAHFEWNHQKAIFFFWKKTFFTLENIKSISDGLIHLHTNSYPCILLTEMFFFLMKRRVCAVVLITQLFTFSLLHKNCFSLHLLTPFILKGTKLCFQMQLRIENFYIRIFFIHLFNVKSWLQTCVFV